MGVLAVAREFFERALIHTRDRTDRRAIGERLCELAEMQDFHEYHELHGTPPSPPSCADDDPATLSPLRRARDRHGSRPLSCADHARRARALARTRARNADAD